MIYFVLIQVLIWLWIFIKYDHDVKEANRKADYYRTKSHELGITLDACYSAATGMPLRNIAKEYRTETVRKICDMYGYLKDVNERLRVILKGQEEELARVREERKKENQPQAINDT